MYSYYLGLKTSLYTASLTNMKNLTRNGPFTVFGETLDTKAEHGVLLDGDITRLIQPEVYITSLAFWKLSSCNYRRHLCLRLNRIVFSYSNMNFTVQNARNSLEFLEKMFVA